MAKLLPAKHFLGPFDVVLRHNFICLLVKLCYVMLRQTSSIMLELTY
jgi:hypothetical protein